MSIRKNIRFYTQEKHMESMFVEAPVLVLEDQDAVALALAQREGDVCNVHKPVKSLWICDLIREIEADGKYPYNQTVYYLAENKLGLPRTNYNAPGKRETLSWLVYYAQGYRREDDLRKLGYQPLTQALIDEAYSLGKKIEIHLGEPFIVITGHEPEMTRIYNVRQVGGKFYAMIPGARTHALCISGQPAKLV
jgi:hypothetical protein